MEREVDHIHKQIKKLRMRMDERFDKIDDRLQKLEKDTAKNVEHNEAQNGRIEKLEREEEEETVDWLKRQTRKWSPHITIIIFLLIEYLKGCI